MRTWWRRYAGAFSHRDFRLLVISFLVDSAGSWAASVVLAVYVFDRTDSVTWLAVMAAARWIPGMLVGPVAGVLADRYDRRLVMVVSAVGSAAMAVSMCVVVGFDGPVIVLLVLQVMSALVGAPYQPAAGALTPDIVGEESLAAANGLFAALENLVLVIGPAIGGLLLVVHSPAIGLAINAVSFVVAAFIASSLALRSRGSASAGESAVREFLDGVDALRAAPTAAVLLIFAALDTVLAGTYAVVYIPISEHLGTGTNGYSYLLAAGALGGVVGAGIADRFSAAGALAPIIIGGLLAQALPYAITPFTSSPVIGALLQVISGLGMVFVDILALTAMQREVAGGLLSRVLSLLDTVALAASVVGSFGTSALLATLSYRVALIVLGLGVAVVGVALTPLLIGADKRAAGVAAELADRVELLSSLPLFAGSSRPVLERLAAALTPDSVTAGEQLIREGDPADALWILADGSLSVTSSTTSADIPDVLAPDVVGEIGVLRGLPRTATVVARTEAHLWRLQADVFRSATEPERRPLSLLGPVTARLARTHPQLVVADNAA